MFLARADFEKLDCSSKDLLAKPCLEMLAGGLCLPFSKHFKRKRQSQA
jgi:hypothetical protein